MQLFAVIMGREGMKKKTNGSSREDAMLEIMSGMPENVVAVAASGKVTGRDYDDVLIPAIEAKLANRRKIRVLYQLGPEFTGFTAEAMWDDAKVGLWHLTEFERVAVVSDIEWLRSSLKLFGFIIPCPVRIFSNCDLAAAKSWISSTAPG
jgi:hypothetical protein